MAVTGFWPVFKNLQATLDYADNPDKTTAPEYLDEDLYTALRYPRLCSQQAPAPHRLLRANNNGCRSARGGIPISRRLIS